MIKCLNRIQLANPKKHPTGWREKELHMNKMTKQTLLMTIMGIPFFSSVLTAAPNEMVNKQLQNFRDLIETGGWTMYVIIALSALTTFFVLLFLFTLRANALFPKSFIREAEDAAEEGDIEALQALCEENDSAAARIIGAAAEQMAGEQRADYMIVRDGIEDEGGRQAGHLWQRIQYLLDIAVVAPMVGLLGTVLGMLESFSGLKMEVGAVKPVELAQGVSKALVTTASGLTVGIAAMILYAIFRGRVNKLISELEHACSRVLRRLLGKRLLGNKY